MSIFKRPDAPASTQPGPGVVPPPASPMYMMRPKPPGDAPRTVQIAVQSTRTAPAPAVCERPPLPPARPTLPASDPVACGLLNLAWRWAQAGAPIRAIHAYTELLERYPDTSAASEAISDLVELSQKLAADGQFHLALSIYDYLEALA